MSARAKKRSAFVGVAGVLLAAGSGAWLWRSTARAQQPEAPPVLMDCAVVANGVAVLDANGSDAVVGQPAIGVAGAPGITAHFGAIPCLVQACGDAPRLISVCPALANPHQSFYVYPGAPSTGGISTVEVLFNGVVDVAGPICITSTGGSPPAFAALSDLNGAGLYLLKFDAKIELGEWTTALMTVTNPCGVSQVCIHLGWLPDDVDQNGQVSLNDATQFGAQFNGAQEVKLADLNDDGQVNLNDATKFGQVWNGTSDEGFKPDGTGPWLGQGLGPLPACTCP